MPDKPNKNRKIKGKPAKGQLPPTQPAVYVIKPPKPPKWWNRKRDK